MIMMVTMMIIMMTMMMMMMMMMMMTMRMKTIRDVINESRIKVNVVMACR